VRPAGLLSAHVGLMLGSVSDTAEGALHRKGGDFVSISAVCERSKSFSAQKGPKNGLKIWLANMDSNHD